MVLDNLNGLLNCLSEALKKNDFSEDRKIIQYFYDELKQTKESLPTDEKLNELQNVEIYLETKYEIFYELGNYFDPFYVELKHKIHEAKVSNLYFFAMIFFCVMPSLALAHPGRTDDSGCHYCRTNCTK